MSKIYLWNPNPPEGDFFQDEPEDKICPKCLEVIPCQCDIIDKIEAVELARQNAEQKMSNLKKINPCDGCEIKGKSHCCCAEMINGLCSECLEPTETTCDHCDFKTI